MAAASRFMGSSQSDTSTRMSPEMQLKSMAAVALASGIVSSSMAADAVQWRVEDGGNGHWYEIAANASGMSKDQAIGIASSRGGRLVDIDSAAESEFVRAVSDIDSAWGNQWVGPIIGLSCDGSTCAAGCWDSGAQVTFTNWRPGNPDFPETDQCVMLFQRGIADWQNFPCDSQDLWGVRTVAAVIEWSADCNNDGIVDYGQCRDGSLPDYNGNNIPDCCEQGASCVLGSYPVQWRSEDGGNGHWYEMLDSGHAVFDVKRDIALSRGADLASISSPAENHFVYQVAAASGEACRVTVGGQRCGSCAWQWSDGSSWRYENWGVGEPGNAGDVHVEMFVGFGEVSRWADVNDWDGSCSSIIMEYALDCNSDGIVDYGQILRGELVDTNTNGVPDLCESTILVPSQFPTIQAAIDSVPAGAQRTVQVAAGTYNESFSLNGKNVVIRGAANNATILDGTGLAASIATITGGEPATGGLENLVFRNATVGSLIYKGALFKVGGAVYGRDSSAVIRNCRFEGNRSDYGGGAYLLYCNMLVEGCEFTGNTGIAQGGGLMVFGTTGTVRNCSFTGNQCGIAGIGGGSAFKAAGALLTGESVTFDGCTVTGNTAGVEGGAVEYYENVELNPGTLHIVNSTITGNRSGNGTLAGAGGVMIAGRMQSVVVHGGTTVCDNVPRNIEGPYFIAGAPTICDCMADLSGDGAVNGGDLGLLLNAWGGTLPTGVGDVNHDGIVDGVDLAELLGNWGACN